MAAQTWSGTVSGNIEVAANWSGTVPSGADTATIPTGCTNYPTAGTYAASGALVIDVGGSINGGYWNSIAGGITNNGTITDGTFDESSSYTIDGAGSLAGGKYYGTITSVSGLTISGGHFYNTASVTNTSEISGGIFDCYVGIGEDISQPIISGGIFNGQVDLGGTGSGDGLITAGIFYGPVICSVAATGAITGGTFYDTVDAVHSITGGTFTRTSVVTVSINDNAVGGTFQGVLIDLNINLSGNGFSGYSGAPTIAGEFKTGDSPAISLYGPGSVQSIGGWPVDSTSVGGMPITPTSLGGMPVH